MKKSIVLSSGLLIAGALIPALDAQAMCNAFDPNNRIVGYTTGPMGMQIPICAPNAAPSSERESAEPERDELELRNDAATAQVNAMHALAKQRLELLKDPEYQRLSAGYWNLSEQQPGRSDAVGCRATFKSMTGMLGVIVPAKPGEPVMTMFTGMDIPKPDKPKPVEVVLHQSGGETMTIPAMNFTAGPNSPGTIGIGLPDLRSLLAGVKDSEDLAIDLDGKRVYELSYHGGESMKVHMQRCEAALQ